MSNVATKADVKAMVKTLTVRVIIGSTLLIGAVTAFVLFSPG